MGLKPNYNNFARKIKNNFILIFKSLHLGILILEMLIEQ